MSPVGGVKVKNLNMKKIYPKKTQTPKCKHLFWKDRNPNTCFNCGKTEEELLEEFFKEKYEKKN